MSLMKEKSSKARSRKALLDLIKIPLKQIARAIRILFSIIAIGPWKLIPRFAKIA